MKRILVLAALLFVSTAAVPAHASFGISFGAFYSSLGSHGEWISVEPDLYAWRPLGVGHGWRPYFTGQWVWTDDGWYWDSPEPWAWAVYHYGRWYYDDYYGWVWVPGYDWAPAWVEWRYGGDYIGWAPLGPYAVFSVNYGIYYHRHWVTPYDYWSFVDCRYMGSSDVHRFVYRSENNSRFIGRTRSGGAVRSSGGRIVTRGPEPAYIERKGNVRVKQARIVDVQERERIGVVREAQRVDVYRPRIERGSTERPTNLREANRAMNLDAGSMDLRPRTRETAAEPRRTDAQNLHPQPMEVKPDGPPARITDPPKNEGRDLRRAEEYRQRARQQEMQKENEPKIERRMAPQPRASDREGYQPRLPREERRVERVPEPRKEQQVERPRMQRDERPRYSPGSVRQAPAPRRADAPRSEQPRAPERKRDR
jgi:hypothetical protein